MKKILTISLLVFSILSQAQDWKLFGTIAQLPSANQYEFTVRNNNRPVVAYVLPSNDLEVQEWNGQEWILMNPIVPGDQVEDVDVVQINNSIYVGFFDITQSKYLVFNWDGSTWNQVGDTGVNGPYTSGTASLEVSEAQPGIYLSYIDGGNSVQVKKWNGAT
ncbi:MAG: hypothetical protein H6582_15230, partial [Crocinitomicaceae bacterium]|nr:hypothetical protein [Crocinitomicaceae bacterium]